MPALTQVPVAPASPERFRDLVGEDYAAVERAANVAGQVLAGRVVWHVNSTARGGGVAEMLQSLLAYARGVGVDVRWLTIGGDPTSSGSPSGSITTSTVQRVRRLTGTRRARGLRPSALAAADELVDLVRDGTSSTSTTRSRPA